MSCENITSQDPWILLDYAIFYWYDYIAIILIVIAIVGNSLVILIQSRLGGSRVGGTSANRLIIGLAAADLLTALFYFPIPEFINVPKTPAGEFYCRAIEPKSLAWICFMASVYTLTAISLERYLAIVHPFTYRVWMQRDYLKYAFFLIWLSSIIINLFSFIFRDTDECGRCFLSFPSSTSRTVCGVFLFIIEYFGPLCVMTYTNIYCIVKLRQYRATRYDESNAAQTKGTFSRDSQALHSRLTKMFTLIIVIFMLLWTPDQVCYLLYNLGVLSGNFTNTVVYRLFVKAAFLNCCTMNPIVYSVWVPSFRRALKAYVTCQDVPSGDSSTS